MVQADIKNVRAMYMLAALEKNSGNLDKAMAVYRRILEVKPSETLAQNRWGYPSSKGRSGPGRQLR